MFLRRAAVTAAPARLGSLLRYPASWGPKSTCSLSSMSRRSPRIDEPTGNGDGGRGALAVERGIKGSVFKLNLLARQVAGKNVKDALAQMEFSEKRRSRLVKDVITTACERAEEFHGLQPDELYIAEALCGRGSYRKKPFFRGRGKVDMKQKTTSQLTVIVREDFRDPSTARKGRNPRRMKNRRRPGEQ
jgi:large subunit ribosomal protein L22